MNLNNNIMHKQKVRNAIWKNIAMMIKYLWMKYKYMMINLKV